MIYKVMYEFKWEKQFKKNLTFTETFYDNNLRVSYLNSTYDEEVAPDKIYDNVSYLI